MKRTHLLFVTLCIAALCISCKKEQRDLSRDNERIMAANNGIVATDDPTDVGALTATLNGLVAPDRPEGSIYWFIASTEAKTVEELKATYHSQIVWAERDGTKISATKYFLDYGKTYYYVAGTTTPYGEWIYADEVRSFVPKLSDGPAVDMGLSVKWASCNVGATKPNEAGGHYQWGGLSDVTKPSSKLGWTNCPYHSGKDYKNGWQKYITKDFSSYWSGKGSPDNKTVLEKADDIASKKLGGKWRMPTKEEYQELVENSERVWHHLDDVYGCFYTSKKPGYKGKSIFLPASGFVMEKTVGNDGISGYYWSSSITLDSQHCAYLLSVSNSPGDGNLLRYYGLSVRPVQTK